MSIVDLKLAQYGMGMTEATVLRWLKKPGDGITAGEILVEVESAKAVIEVESPVTGRLVQVAAEEGVSVPVYELLGLIETDH